MESAGRRFRTALAQECPLQIVGVINAYTALLAEREGFRALYLSGAGVANASHGLPDLGVTSLQDVLDDARRITAATPLPLLVDIDTGWGSPLTIERAVRELIRSDVAAVHLEDQVDTKRCGHRAGKQLVSVAEMNERIQAAVAARTDASFVIMARTDAVAGEGLKAAIHRAQSYVEQGADMIFAEAITSLDDYRTFTQELDVPVLANITEFGKTPLFTVEELATARVQLVLYPLTAFRAMSAAAIRTYSTIRKSGTQKELLPEMQTRQDLYSVLNYEATEARLPSRQAE